MRFGVSVDSDLLEKFDSLSSRKGYENRSEALRDLMREALVADRRTQGDGEVVGTVTLMFDHHARGLSSELTGHQHAHHHEILSTLHIHLDHQHCLEVVVVKGKVEKVKRIASELIGKKGVKHGDLVMTATGVAP